MTQVTSIRPARRQACRHRWGADLVTPERLQQSVGGVRHVTVITGASGRRRCVLRVRGEVRREGRVALKARLVAIHVGSELVARPGSRRALVIRGSVHLMT